KGRNLHFDRLLQLEVDDRNGRLHMVGPAADHGHALLPSIPLLEELTLEPGHQPVPGGDVEALLQGARLIEKNRLLAGVAGSLLKAAKKRPLPVVVHREKKRKPDAA